MLVVLSRLDILKGVGRKVACSLLYLLTGGRVVSRAIELFKSLLLSGQLTSCLKLAMADRVVNAGSKEDLST